MSGQCLCVLSVKLELLAPWLVHGNDPGRLGLDAVQLLNADGRRVLPGTLLVGRIRDTWVALRERGLTTVVPKPETWFGQEQAKLSGPTARVHVDDLVEQSEGALHKLEVSTRLQFNTLAGAGADGLLLAIEQREPAGTRITFSGLWHAWLTADEAAYLPHALAQGLRWHSQMGAMRNIGFGEVLAVEVQATPVAVRVPVADWPMPTPGAGPAALHAELTLDFGSRPIAVANRQINGNLFESGELVPGATIKAALARTLLKHLGTTALPDWFNALRITHALPSGTALRPLPLSMSLGFDGQDRLHDLAGLPESAPRGDDGEALRFQPDWKPADWARAGTKQPRGALRRHLRVRTAIESGQAKRESLFAYNCVLADPNLGTPDEPLTVWRATLDLPADHASDEARALLAQALGSGLPLGPIGKTDAFANTVIKSVTPPCTPTLAQGAAVHLMLVSDALLCPTAWLLGHTSATPLDLTAICQRAFSEIAAATLPKEPEAAAALGLTQLFSRQRMAGGQYLQGRFMQPGQAYLPYLLFEAGSVFVFNVAHQALAARLLGHWCQHGLPIGASTAARHGGDWRRNPYLPQNGYGEVALLPTTATTVMSDANAT